MTLKLAKIALLATLLGSFINTYADSNAEVNKLAHKKKKQETSKKSTDAKNSSQDKKKEKKLWKGNLLFGFTENTGNTRNSSLNGGIDVTYRPGQWRYNLALSAQGATTKKERTAEKYVENFEARYKFENENFIFGTLSGTQNPFATYDRVYLASVGYGWQVFKTDSMKLNFQAGPGYRYQRQSGKEKYTGQPILYSQLGYRWKINDRVTFKQIFNLEAASPNLYASSTTSLETKLIDKLGLNLSYNVDYNSHIPRSSPNRQKVDTTTIIAATYEF